MEQRLFYDPGINANGIYAPEISLIVKGLDQPLSLEETIKFLRQIADKLNRH